MAVAKFRHQGFTIDYTPSGASLVAGQVVDLGTTGMQGVAVTDIPDGVKGALQIDGVYEVTAIAATGAIGDECALSAGADPAVTVGAGPHSLVTAANNVADPGELVYVKINTNLKTTQV